MANTKITTNVIADNAVGITQLNVSDGSSGQFLKTDGSGTLSFATVTGTTINNNADNRVITGSGTANTLEGEANLTFDGSTLAASAAPFTISNTSNGNNIDIKTTSGGSLVHSVKIHSGGVFEAKQGAVFNEDSNDVDFRVESNGNTHMLFVDGGNNKIGIGTSSPSNNLDIFTDAGDEGLTIKSTGNTSNAIILDANRSGAGSSIGEIQSKWNGTTVAMIASVTGSDTTNKDDGELRFYTSSANNIAEKMRIHGSGCVGVGSTSDRSIDTNIGTLVVNGSSGGGLWLSPGDSSAMSSKIYAEANGSVGDLIINNGTGVGSGGIRIQTNAAQKMMIDSAGRLLINQTSSNLTYAKLQVSEGSASAGHGGIVGFFDTDVSVGSSNVIQVLWFSGDDDATGGVFTRFRDGNSIMGQIEAANGTQVSYGVSSDERLKKNIVDASSQLNTIKNIKVREFDWKANGYHEVGMIAQELHTVIPSAVQEGGDDLSEEPWGVDYSKLTPYLIKAVQEQQTIIEDLKTRIEALEK
tara:strand:+ start:3943 stop:5520 length:1578 start_codon:yes stop_codon:yes gene_type:complete